MVVFKKPSKAVPTSWPQTSQSLNGARSSSDTTATSEQHDSTNKAPPAPLRYSDITAGRDAKDNGTPIEKLMYIPELCDRVLDYLPLEELFCATRVCIAFKTNIENSSRLQAKLFLASDLTIKEKAVSANGTLLSGAKAEHHIAACRSAEGSSSGEIVLYQVHPWLQVGRLPDRYRRMGMVRYAKVCLETRGDFDVGGLSFRNRKLIELLPDTSSINKMFISQPPAKEVSIWYPCPSMGMQRKERIRNEAGVTIGEVIKAARWKHGMQNLIPRGIEVILQRGFVASVRARDVVEQSGELNVEEDPTRWLLKDDKYMLKDGGFAFA
ncbi:hypothetical protein MBLNU13_g02391t1 [Cladosporium sp. NU13]